MLHHCGQADECLLHQHLRLWPLDNWEPLPGGVLITLRYVPQVALQMLFHLSGGLLEPMLFLGDGARVGTPYDGQVQIMLHLEPPLEHLQCDFLLLHLEQPLAHRSDFLQLVLLGPDDLADLSGQFLLHLEELHAVPPGPAGRPDFKPRRL